MQIEIDTKSKESGGQKKYDPEPAIPEIIALIKKKRLQKKGDRERSQVKQVVADERAPSIVDEFYFQKMPVIKIDEQANHQQDEQKVDPAESRSVIIADVFEDGGQSPIFYKDIQGTGELYRMLLLQ